MKVSGQHTIAAGRQEVWDALQDPAVLARTLPGCEALEVTGPDAYAATITAGVASVRGTYQGQVTLTDLQAPSSYTLLATGAGAPGTVQAEAKVFLEEPDAGTTTVRYDADAVVGGMIGGVGQRMLASVARRTAGEFFGAVERDLLEGPVEATLATGAPEDRAPAAGSAAASTGDQRAEVQLGKVFRAAASRPGPGAADRRVAELAVALLVGAAIALVGVLIGRRSVR